MRFFLAGAIAATMLVAGCGSANDEALRFSESPLPSNKSGGYGTGGVATTGGQFGTGGAPTTGGAGGASDAGAAGSGGSSSGGTETGGASVQTDSGQGGAATGGAVSTGGSQSIPDAGPIDPLGCPNSPGTWTVYTVQPGDCLSAGDTTWTGKQICVERSPTNGKCDGRCDNYIHVRAPLFGPPIAIAIMPLAGAVIIGSSDGSSPNFQNWCYHLSEGISPR